MSQFVIVSLIILFVAVTMTMVGKGGGNFYVLILAMAGIPMHQAATTGQFILFTAAVAAMCMAAGHFYRLNNSHLSFRRGLFFPFVQRLCLENNFCLSACNCRRHDACS